MTLFTTRLRLLLLIPILLVLLIFAISFNCNKSNSKTTITADEHFRRIKLSEMSGQKELINIINNEVKVPGAVEWWVPGLPIIYAVTPTYERSAQIAELTRLSQTLMLVPNLYWIICEDAEIASKILQRFMERLSVPHTHLLTPMPSKYRQESERFGLPKGVSARNAGIEWVRNNNKTGVLYFMDDDNTYDIRVFEEMRWTRRVSMWPVGLVTELSLSAPILKDGRFMGWYDGYIFGRQYPVDMAGFATNIQYLNSIGNVKMPFKSGNEENGYLASLKIAIKDIEFKANDCTQLLVWHTKTYNGPLGSRLLMNKVFDNTSISELRKSVIVEEKNTKNRDHDYKDLIKEALRRRE